jgi:hypothetical protein
MCESWQQVTRLCVLCKICRLNEETVQHQAYSTTKATLIDEIKVWVSARIKKQVMTDAVE